MPKTIYGLMICALLLASCKKDDTNENPAFDGSAPGKVKSINNAYWSFKYTEEGLLSEYKYTTFGAMNTATLLWETNQVTSTDGQAYHFIRPRDASGYAHPGNGDVNAGNNWTYDVNHQITYLNGANYYWSNGNIDSLTFGGTISIYEYSTQLDNRDYGVTYVPLLTNFPVEILKVVNLKTKLVQLNTQRDTISIRSFIYEFDGSSRVSKETEYELISGSPQYVIEKNFSYY